MVKAIIWLGLFVGTAITDWLSAKWVDSPSASRRGLISAIHEAIGYVAGFAVYTVTQDFWMIVPCVAGAWLGSWYAGLEHEIDPDLLEAITDAVALALDKRNEMGNRG